MTYYLNGCRVSPATARMALSQSYLDMGGDPAALNDIWAACLADEDARDNYLPSHIEIIA